MTWVFVEQTKRKKISTKQRAEIFKREHGICHFCGMKILAGEDWDASHDNEGLWAGGSDDISELKPAHTKKCHRPHTSRDQSQQAKERRVLNKHIGAHRSKSPMPCGRNSNERKKFDGRVVDRRTGEPIR